MSESMLNPRDPMLGLLERDTRFRFEAYAFVFDALQFANDRLDMGKVHDAPEISDERDDECNEGDEVERHVTGQDLCEAMRQYALDQYGLMAQSVLSHWGLHSTGDIGDVVFNLIDIEKMRKTEHDRREDFDDVFDFKSAFCNGYQITMADPSEGFPE